MRALIVVALIAGSAQASPELANPFVNRIGHGIDLDLAGGVRITETGDTRPWFARARIGALLFDEPDFLSFGIAGQLGVLASSSVGVELAYSSVFRGFTAQAGVYPLDTVGGTIVSAQLGWTVFGAEYQRRLSGPREDQALVFVVHVPVGVIYQMLRRPPGVTSDCSSRSRASR